MTEESATGALEVLGSVALRDDVRDWHHELLAHLNDIARYLR